MKKTNIMPTVVLGSICLVVALLLSFVNMVTGPIIQASQEKAANAALLEVLPEGSDFTKLTIDESYPSAIVAGYKANGGFVFQTSVTGKSSGMVIMCGINADGKIVGTKVIAEQETDSYDANVFPAVEGTDGAYKGMSLEGFEPFLVSGATLTSRAYGEAMKASLQAFVIANGGEVDIRTPEQILNDNCNAALDTEGLVFTRLFLTEVLEGVDAVYASDAGKVFVVGETFVGVKADGAMGETGEVDPIVIATASDKLAASTLTSVTELPEGIHKSITSVARTESGNYVFEIKAEGFSIHQYDEYSSGANLPMEIKVSISSDGRIIDVITLSHGESQGYGDKCDTEEYYATFRGATADKIVISKAPITGETTDPGAISGATYTANGYQKAIQRAFAAFELLNGGVSND